MRKLFLFTLFAAMLCGLYSFNRLQSAYENIFNQLGIGTEEAESYISGNLISGGSSFPRSRIMVALAQNKREEAIKEIGKYVKAYVAKPEFAKEYETARMDMKPQKPTDPLSDEPEVMAVYKEDVKHWEEEYPPTVNALLKKKLNEFLQQTSGIDYNAKLESSGSKMIFSNPEYEAKDSFWKACYRSGKPTVDAARAYAQQWLSELN